MSRIPWQVLTPWLNLMAIAAWGLAILKFWITGELFLLIHPNYKILTIAAGLALLLIAGVKGFYLWKSNREPRAFQPDLPHATLFPPALSSGLLLIVAIAGLVITPRAFASQTAIDRGVNDSITLTRVKPQTFRASARTEDKSLIDWIRTLQVYPEPDAYTGQKAKLQGFVVTTPELSQQYFLLTRFVITCCAADVYPVRLPVKLSSGKNSDYKVDSWLEVEGQMITETIAGKRQLVVQANSIKPIPEPKNPYDY
jgi:uncharacterized repeat protein (TIGR03943 family)